VHRRLLQNHPRSAAARRTPAEDGIDEPRPVAVVNRAFGDVYFGKTDPLGRQIRVTLPSVPGAAPAPRAFEIVGVVDDVQNQGLRDVPAPEVHPPVTIPGIAPVVLVRTHGQPESVGNAIRRELNALDRRVAIRSTSLNELLETYAYARPRFSVVVLGIFSAAGMLLVAIGVFSVMAYTVSQQTQEFAVRMALGARRRQVCGTVLRWAGTLVAAGVAAGLCASLLTNRLIADQLWNVSPHDVLTIAATIAIVGVVAIAACLVPARRAMSVEPMIALRRD
jgi:putative ABC transport system permease protein